MQRYLAAWSAVLCLVALFHSIVGAPAKRGVGGTVPTYKDFQISDGTAGDAFNRAKAAYTKYAGEQIFDDLKSITPEKRNIIAEMRKTAQEAEAGFVAKLAGLDPKSAERAAVLRGMISNKVLKLTGILLLIESDIAISGKSNASSDSPDQVKKLLNNNIKLDTAAKGLPQTPVPS